MRFNTEIISAQCWLIRHFASFVNFFPLTYQRILLCFKMRWKYIRIVGTVRQLSFCGQITRVVCFVKTHAPTTNESFQSTVRTKLHFARSYLQKPAASAFLTRDEADLFLTWKRSAASRSVMIAPAWPPYWNRSRLVDARQKKQSTAIINRHDTNRHEARTCVGGQTSAVV